MRVRWIGGLMLRIGSMDGGMTMTMGNMLMYFHFTPGDNLWFLGWAPYSAGAMVGTCIGLFLLALIERWLAAMKAVMEVHWHTRALIEMANRVNTKSLPQHAQATPKSAIRQHMALPFIPAHDLPRGIIAAALALLGFLFMLAVMTFQVGFILSIVVGLGVGETLFGRYGRGMGQSMHC
ncbi:Ctr copper transporter family-domain-containing protein [Vararia minispora EC-137]|uniref:Ctr copper transporter family-domain-containing protein n=1 Tax=Vararia minispora EC-137 TaxID=1314806 RepID=A0ACB8Q8G2_9AGAM|nr:Ctr copper transporter family-domain-containing protein [Vararia minispora EC-137]